VLKIYLAIENANKETEIKKLVTCRNLSGLRFRNLNLPQADFQSSKLHSASFENCDLTLSKLNGCIFRETFISDTTKLNGAAVRGAVLESIRTDRKFLSEQKEIATFFYERTLIPQSENKGPCQAAINLKRIFEKLLRKGKGYKMPRTFLLNTKCGGGMEANKIIEELVRNDYFIAVDEYLRIPVKEYDSVAAYVGDFQLTDGISKILNSTCEDARTIGCTHIYGTAAMSRLEKVT
jgi:hypothetical protein